MSRKKKIELTNDQQLLLDPDSNTDIVTKVENGIATYDTPSLQLTAEFRDGRLNPSELSIDLDPSYNNEDGFWAYHSRLRGLGGLATDVDTLIAHDLYMICRNTLWKYVDNPNAPEGGIKFTNQDQYLDWCHQDTGIGFSTLQRNVKSYQFALVSGMTNEQIASAGIVPIAQVKEAVETDQKTAEPQKFKHRTLPEDADIKEVIIESIMTLADNRQNSHNNLRNGDTKKLQRELLYPDKVNVYVGFNDEDPTDPQRYWFMDYFKTAEDGTKTKIIRRGMVRFDMDRPDGSLWIGLQPCLNKDTGQWELPKHVQEFFLSKFGLGKK